MTRTSSPTAMSALRRAAERAIHAPSVHNSQPWRFELGPAGLEIYADWDRHLAVLDPHGRQLIISCGCAVFNARAALAASGVGTTVERPSHSERPGLVARLRPTASSAVDPHVARLDAEIEVRRTNRREFADLPVPPDDVTALVDAARTEGAQLFPVEHEDHRGAVARLSQLADRIETTDPAYRAELRRWTTDDPKRPDGVQAFTVPYTDATRHDDVPIRDFDTRGMGWLPSHPHSSRNQCLLLLGTEADDPVAWERAGEALERVLLEAVRLGYTASPLTQIVEVARTRATLRAELGLSMYPHILLRVGLAPATPATRRRPLADVLTETG